MAGYVDLNSLHNPTTGTSPPASWGDAARDNDSWLAGDSASGNPKPMCRVYDTGAQNAANATATALTYNSERFDVGGMHSTSSNTGRITIPTGGGGIYVVTCHIEWAANATGIREVSIRLNGATLLASQNVHSTTALGITMSVSTIYKVAAGDYFDSYVYQTSGGILAVNASGNRSPEFSAVWLGLG